MRLRMMLSEAALRWRPEQRRYSVGAQPPEVWIGLAAASAAIGGVTTALLGRAWRGIKWLTSGPSNRFLAAALARDAIEETFGVRPERAPVEEQQQPGDVWLIVFQMGESFYSAKVAPPPMWKARPSVQVGRKDSQDS